MKRQNLSNILLGILIIAVGVGYLGNSFFNWDFTIFFKGFWTLFLIIPAILNMIKTRVDGFNIILLLVGLYFLAEAYFGDLLRDDILNIVIAIMIIYFGVKLVSRSIFKNKQYRKAKESLNSNWKGDLNDYPNYSAFFGGIDVFNSSDDLKGATIVSIFGGVDCDLSQATVNQDIVIKATSIFGGNTIKMPHNVKIVYQPTSLFGGSDCKANSLPSNAIAPTIYVESFDLFGGSDFI